ncbi:MAG: caspase family protein [Roseiarcus sp.]|uniref:caspase family protein n=1 Tax=Roseiarcus sp. TaxID=1969460 RepID=UPI003C403E91
MRKLMRFLTAAGAAAAGALAQPGDALADDLRAPGGGTIRALVVGVDVYSRLPASVQLQGARADAEDIAEALSRDGVKPVVLFDADVTRANIVARMDSLVAESKPGDLVLFAYAGHGMQTPEYARWQGIDPDGVNEQIALSGFSFSGEGVDEIIVNPEIRAWLSRLDAKGVDAVVIMDSCFGGGMREVDPRTGMIRTRVLRASAAQIRAGEDERGKFAGIPMTDKEARADVELMSHVTFLAGATSRSVVPETPGLAPSGPRGALSYFFARALGGKSAKDGVTTRQALYEYLKHNVRGATQDRQLIQVEPQSPEPSIYGKPVFTFAEAAPADQASNPPPAPGAATLANDGAAPPAQASNAPPPPNNEPPQDQGQAPPPAATDVPLPPGYGPPPTQAPAPPSQASNAPPPPADTPPPDQAPTPPAQASNAPPAPANAPPPDQGPTPPAQASNSPPSSQATGIPLPPGYGPPSGQGAARSDTVRVALIDATDKAWDTIEKGNAPFERSMTVDGADLVWDVGKNEVLSRGDLVMQFVDGSLMGGVIDRTWAVRRLQEIAESRYLSLQLATGGQLLTAGDVAQIEIDGIANQRLVVFDIAADATVQMLYPSAPGAAGHCADPQNNGWRCSLRVTPPFGADTIVTLATSAPTDDILRWMRGHHARRDAALIPDLLADAMKTDSTARIGFVGVFTNRRQ